MRSDFKKHDIPGLKKEFEILPSSISNLTQLVKLHETIQSATELEVTVNNTVMESLDKTLLDFGRFNCWFKLIRVVKFVLKAKYILKRTEVPHQADLQKEAKSILLKSMMTETRTMLKSTKLPGFIIYEKDGLVFAASRDKTANHNPDDLIVLSPKHPVTKMILRSIHEISHRGVSHDLARSRIFYWIPQATKLLKSIKNNCAKCKLLNAKALTQLMSPIPEMRLKASACWHHTMLDLFGPIEVISFVNQRTRRKTWAVILTCLAARCLWVYLAESYSTDHLLSVIRKHEARNGSPAEYHADLGRQIIGADRAITEAVRDLNQQKIEDFAANRNVKFCFGTPYFPEGQGAVERLILEVKKSLKVITKNLLTFGELDTLLSEASYLVNCRPLQHNPSLGEDGFLCPNDILFGRSDRDPPMTDIADTSMTRRAAQKQRIIDEFWSKWSNSYMLTLTKYQKWKHGSRNSKPGDVIIMLDKELQKGKFVRGLVDSVKKDSDNYVRKVTIKYRVPQKCPAIEYKPSVFRYTERNVRGLALLMAAEDRKNAENINIDDLRLSAPISDSSADDDDDQMKDNESSDEQETNQNALKALNPSSTGRRRFLPKKFSD